MKSKRYREKLSLTSTVRVCPQPNCDFSTKSLQNYNYHIDTRHPETVEKKFFCDQCNKGFASDSTLKMHKSRNHQNRKCPYCDYVCNGSNWYMHIDKNHPEHGEKQFFCENCEMGFIFNATLRAHALRKHRVAQFLNRSWTTLSLDMELK